MAMPACTEDVSEIAKIISQKQCLFGMRSGAHSAWKGANSVDDGVTIDFSMLGRGFFFAFCLILANIFPQVT